LVVDGGVRVRIRIRAGRRSSIDVVVAVAVSAAAGVAASDAAAVVGVAATVVIVATAADASVASGASAGAAVVTFVVVEIPYGSIRTSTPRRSDCCWRWTGWELRHLFSLFLLRLRLLWTAVLAARDVVVGSSVRCYCCYCCS